MAEKKEGVCDRYIIASKLVTNTACLENVRILHTTIVSLRRALEKSQNEVHKLKLNVPNKDYKNAVEQLVLENHIPRPQILFTKREQLFMKDRSIHQGHITKSKDQEESNVIISSTRQKIIEDSTGLNDGLTLERGKTNSDVFAELDDTELIFTRDDTTAINLQKEIEPSSDSSYNSQTKIIRLEECRSDASKCSATDNESKNIKNNESSSSSLHELPSELEKISKRLSNFSTPNVQSIQTTITRLVQNRGSGTPVSNSEVQTNISAIPAHWKSESSLISTKRNQNFPTLPSKFVIPAEQPVLKYPLRFVGKTNETRHRILLSDISFTSMIPELSRSVDQLPVCQNEICASRAVQPLSNPTAINYHKNPTIPGTSSLYSNSRFQCNIINSNSNLFEKSNIDDKFCSTEHVPVRKGQFWRPSIRLLNTLNTYSTKCALSVPPFSTLRRHCLSMSGMDTQFSCPLSDEFNIMNTFDPSWKNLSTTSINQDSKSKVSFQEKIFSKHSTSRQSLPNIRVDTESSEDSTESLIDESEECIRNTIDKTSTRVERPCLGYHYVGQTCSTPNLFLVFSPPLSARPFIARSANDLKINYFVKVINKTGKIVGGRIQFVGSVPGRSEPYVGLVLPPIFGETDGSFHGLQLFSCEKNCGLFVPFRKVVIAWKI